MLEKKKFNADIWQNEIDFDQITGWHLCNQIREDGTVDFMIVRSNPDGSRDIIAKDGSIIHVYVNQRISDNCEPLVSVKRDVLTRKNG